jgi:hypothetical protein
MRWALALVAAVALCAAPAASAKFKITLAVGDRTPTVGQPVAVVVRSERRLEYDLELIAVAPDKALFDVVGVVTGDASTAKAVIPRDGFAVPLSRVAPNRWRGLVTFPRPGRWRVLVPNGAAEGFTLPPPAMLSLVVR